jgi:hypothetical protein
MVLSFSEITLRQEAEGSRQEGNSFQSSVCPLSALVTVSLGREPLIVGDLPAVMRYSGSVTLSCEVIAARWLQLTGSQKLLQKVKDFIFPARFWQQQE